MDHTRHDQEPTSKGESFHTHILYVSTIVLFIWSVEITELLLQTSFSHWGLKPRTAQGLLGIVTMPFLHGDFDHVWSNSFGLIALGLMMLQFYRRVTLRVVIISTLCSGALVWLFARPSYHIGASAVIYALSGFLFISGLLRRDRASLGALLIVSFLFGASVWGVLPLQVGISWEGHLFGALTGIALAFIYRNVDLPPSEEETEEPEQWLYNPYREDGGRHGW